MYDNGTIPMLFSLLENIKELEVGDGTLSAQHNLLTIFSSAFCHHFSHKQQLPLHKSFPIPTAHYGILPPHAPSAVSPTHGADRVAHNLSLSLPSTLCPCLHRTPPLSPHLYPTLTPRASISAPPKITLGGIV